MLPEGLSGAALEKAIHNLQDDLTPRQLQQVLPRVLAQGGAVAKAARKVPFLMQINREQAQSFALSRLSRDVRLFADPAISNSRKALLVIFAGSSNMPMMPSAMMLQHIPAALFDVLLFCDRSNRSYETGVDGFEGPMVRTLSNVAMRIEADHYRAIYCYGTSMGGFPALRSGLLLGARRAIAIGGSFAWQVRRLLDDPSFTPAYDPLCVCTEGGKTELVAAYSSEHHRDPGQAAQLAARMDIRHVTRRLRTHNLPHALYLDGELGVFFSTLFDFDPVLLHRPRPLVWLRGAARRTLAFTGMLPAARRVFRLIRRRRTPN